MVQIQKKFSDTFYLVFFKAIYADPVIWVFRVLG